jgi:hypothetical protein
MILASSLMFSFKSAAAAAVAVLACYAKDMSTTTGVVIVAGDQMTPLDEKFSSSRELATRSM